MSGMLGCDIEQEIDIHRVIVSQSDLVEPIIKLEPLGVIIGSR